MSKRKLRLILYFFPWGFSKGQRIDVKFTNQKKYNNNDNEGYPLLQLTRGEGTAMQFVLEDYDAETKFHEAINDGKFLATAQDWQSGHFQMHYVPHGKKIILVDE